MLPISFLSLSHPLRLLHEIGNARHVVFETVFSEDENASTPSPQRLREIDEAPLDLDKTAEIDLLILAFLHGEM